MPRIATLAALSLLAVVVSGCVSIKSQSASQRLPGFVTLRLDLCVSDRDGSTYADCDPGRNTAEGDNGLDGDDESGRGQLLVGFRVPVGTGSPSSFVSSDGSATFTPSASYSAALQARFAAPAGFRWEGYISTERPFDPTAEADRSTPPRARVRATGGRGRRAVRRAVPLARGRGLPGRPARARRARSRPRCVRPRSAGRSASTPRPRASTARCRATSATSAFSRAAGPRPARARPRWSLFPLQNLDGGGLGARTVDLSAASNVPARPRRRPRRRPRCPRTTRPPPRCVCPSPRARRSAPTA